MRKIKPSSLKKNDLVALKYNHVHQVDCFDFGVVHKIRWKDNPPQICFWFEFNSINRGRFHESYTAKPVYFAIDFLEEHAEITLIGQLVIENGKVKIKEPRKLKTKKLKRRK